MHIPFITGIIIGTIFGVVLMCLFITAGRADKTKTSGVLSEERRTKLVEQMFDIFEENKLDVTEIASVLRNSTIANEKTLRATNQLADLILNEKLTIVEAAEIFNSCYDALFYY